MVRLRRSEPRMPNYMLLLYSTPVEGDEARERWAQMPRWDEINAGLRDAGLLVAHSPLHPVTSATTVRVRDGETQITDGPFATTKEVLGGYYILDCADLDEAIKAAARLPLAGYGSVEVRPLVERSELPA